MHNTKNIKMKTQLIILFIIGFLTSSFIVPTTDSECEIAQIYVAIDPDYGTKVLTESGELEEPEYILIPEEIDEGTYKVSVTRKASNLYMVDGTDFYLETRYCYEYATYDDAFLVVESNYGYTKGKIIFE